MESNNVLRETNIGGTLKMARSVKTENSGIVVDARVVANESVLTLLLVMVFFGGGGQVSDVGRVTRAHLLGMG